MPHPLPRVQLPPPHTDEWEWQLHGACRSMPIHMFFPPYGLRGPARAKIERNAKLVCAPCPVIERCLRHATQTREPYGIWGGLTPTERLHHTTPPHHSAHSHPPARPTEPPHRTTPIPLQENPNLTKRDHRHVWRVGNGAAISNRGQHLPDTAYP